MPERVSDSLKQVMTHQELCLYFCFPQRTSWRLMTQLSFNPQKASRYLSQSFVPLKQAVFYSFYHPTSDISRFRS